MNRDWMTAQWYEQETLWFDEAGRNTGERRIG